MAVLLQGQHPPAECFYVLCSAAQLTTDPLAVCAIGRHHLDDELGVPVLLLYEQQRHWVVLLKEQVEAHARSVVLFERHDADQREALVEGANQVFNRQVQVRPLVSGEALFDQLSSALLAEQLDGVGDEMPVRHVFGER